MKAVFFNEFKLNIKQLIIWTFAIGGIGLACILLYQSMQQDMKDMADMFSNMGAFSDAFGMSTLSIATLKGYFATEVGTVHGLGSGMFAAIIAVGIVAKEEERHTGEFLLSLPISRTRVLISKGTCVCLMLITLTLITSLIYMLGFIMLDEAIPYKELITFMSCQLLMNIEISGICFMISASKGRNNMGLSLGIVLLLYVFDLIGRVVPDMKDYLFLGPYSYSNASEIFSGKETPALAVILGVTITAICILCASLIYNRRDINA